MKVYIVTAGEYSDYHICEVFLDKEKAEKYVAVKNELYQYDECWVNELETYDDKVKMTDKVAHYYYCHIDMDGQITVNDDCSDETILMIDKGNTIIRPNEFGIEVYSQNSFKHAKKVCIETYQRITWQKFEDGVD